MLLLELTGLTVSTTSAVLGEITNIAASIATRDMALAHPSATNTQEATSLDCAPFYPYFVAFVFRYLGGS